MLQAAPRGLMKDRVVVLSASDHVLPPLGNKMPDGVIIGRARLQRPIRREEPDQRLVRGGLWPPPIRDSIPVQPHYRAAQGLLGLKTAVEKAMAANGGKKPTSEEMAAAMVGIEWDAPARPYQAGARRRTSGHPIERRRTIEVGSGRQDGAARSTSSALPPSA